MVEKEVLSQKMIWPPDIGKRTFKWRWITITLGPLLFLIAYQQGEFLNAFVSCIVGIIGGFLIDLIGVQKLGFYSYPRQKFLTRDYFSIVSPAWGVFGMTINMPWNWLVGTGIQFYSYIILTAVLMVFYELLNFKSVSWRYYVPKWIVILGWIPMIIAFRTTFLLLSYLTQMC